MENDAVKLCCPNECCQEDNLLTEKFCFKCGVSLPKRYLWAVGNDQNLKGDNNYGTVLGDRYLIVNDCILLDTKPGLLPQIPDIEKLETVKPYLKLISYRLNTPQLYGILTLPGQETTKEILLLEKPPVIVQPITDPDNIQAHLCNTLENVWSQASSMRQIHWLWQIANLWQPLLTEGVASTLMDTYLLRVEGPIIRLLELRLDGRNAPKLAKLGEFWQNLAKTAQPKIVQFIEQTSNYLIQGQISSSEQLIQVLDRALTELAGHQTTNITIYTKTDPGPSRQRNEDACYPPSEMLSKEPLAIVCDGIGGHEGGNVASKLAIDSIKQNVQQLLELPSKTSQKIKPAEFISQYDLEQYVGSANDLISQNNDDHHKQGRQRMGTTIVMALPIGHEMYITHVGDSRAYWISKDNCYQVTLDDDVASREVRLGYALYREALQHSGSGSLVQALGMSKSSSLHPTSQRFIIDEDAVFLLTSDGLSDFDRVEEYWDSEILPLLKGEKKIENVTNKLIEIANTKNGHDNVTVALVHYQIQYSEPENIIEANISDLTTGQTINLTPAVNGESSNNYPIPYQTTVQNTAIASRKPGIFSQQNLIWIGVIAGIGFIILAFFVLFQLKGNNNPTTEKTPTPSASATTNSTESSSPESPSPESSPSNDLKATNKQLANFVPRNLDNLQQGWVIKTQKPTKINETNYQSNTFFKVLDRVDENGKKEVKVTLGICQTASNITTEISIADLKKLEKNRDITVIQLNQPNGCNSPTGTGNQQ